MKAQTLAMMAMLVAIASPGSAEDDPLRTVCELVEELDVCTPCYNQVGAPSFAFTTNPRVVLGYNLQLKMPAANGMVVDDRYGASGKFIDLDDEKDTDGNVVFFKYELEAGISRFADKCY